MRCAQGAARAARPAVVVVLFAAGCMQVPASSTEAPRGQPSVRLEPGLNARVDDDQLRLSLGERAEVSVRARLLARGDAQRVAQRVVGRTRVAGRTELRRPGWSEWYRDTPNGIEQGFTFDRRPLPNAAGPLRVVLELAGASASARADHAVLQLPDGARIHVGELVAWDATKRRLATRFVAERGALVIELEDRDAQYPVVIDPTYSAGGFAELMLPGGSVEYTQYGQGIAIDGTVAAITTQEEGLVIKAPGALLIYENGAFVQHYQPSDANPSEQFGGGGGGAVSGVAVSGDRIAIGAAYASPVAAQSGVVYVLQKQASGTWAEIQRLYPEPPAANARLGGSVAMEGDLLVAGTLAQKRIYSYLWNGSKYIQQEWLTSPSGGALSGFGKYVVLSDGMLATGEWKQFHVFLRAGGRWRHSHTTPDVTPNTNPRFDFDRGRIVYYSGQTNVNIVRLTEDGSATASATTAPSTGYCPAIDGNLVLTSDAFDGAGPLRDVIIEVYSDDGSALTPQSSVIIPQIEASNPEMVASAGSVMVSNYGAHYDPPGDPPNTCGADPWALCDYTKDCPDGSDEGWGCFTLRVGRTFVGSTSVSGLALGASCGATAECATGQCVDGVCCSSACGGGAADCQACSRAHGAAVDGTCGDVEVGFPCAGGECIAGGVCQSMALDGSVVGIDAGPSDAGPSDAGPSDAPGDAGPSDAGSDADLGDAGDAGADADLSCTDAGTPWQLPGAVSKVGVTFEEQYGPSLTNAKVRVFFAMSDGSELGTCSQGLDFSGGGGFCLTVGNQEDCVDLTLSYKGVCESPVVCETPPTPSCDDSAYCCTTEATGRLQGTRTVSVSRELSSEKIGDWFAAEASASIFYAVGGQLKYSSAEGPGCTASQACAGGQERSKAGGAVDFSLGAKGSAKLKLFGEEVGGVSIGGTGCVQLGLDATWCGESYDGVGLSGGFAEELKLPELDFFFVTIEPVSITLLAYPKGFQCP